MTELPPGWEWARLDDVAKVRLGRQRSPKNHSGTHMRPYLRAANVSWDGLKLSDVKQMNFTDVEADAHRLALDDIVVVEASGSPGGVGKPAIWRGEIGDCCLQNTLIRVRAIGVNPRYLLHFLDGEARRGGFISRSRGVGINHLGSSRLAAWAVPIPPLDEQRRIVGALESHLSRIEVGERSLAGVEHKTTVIRRAVIGEALAELVGCETTLGEVLLEPLTNGRSVPTRAGGFGVLRLTALKGGRIDVREKKDGAWSAVEAAPFLIREDDFLVSRGSGSLDYVGRGGLVAPNPPPVAFPDTLIRVRTDQDLVDKDYLRILWDSTVIRSQIEAGARTTAGIHKINQVLLRGLKLPAPSLSRQRTIVDKVEAVSSTAARCGETMRAAQMRGAQLRRSLLTEAFAGRLVPQDPNDEPVSVLLDRIKAERN